MKRRCCFAITVMIGAMCSSPCWAQPGVRPDPATGIEGVISIGPIRGGPSRVGVADSKPLANVAFVVKNEKTTVASFTTDDQGRFKVPLAPGHYVVAMKEGKPRLGHYGPFEVDVVQGTTTKVQWNCDSGIR
jgi:hypothetical protein